MASITFGTTAGNWSDNTKWVGGAKPTSSDDAIFTTTSANCTIDTSGLVCKTLNCTGYTGTLTHNAFTLTISGSVTFVSTMTYTLAGGGLTMNATGTLTTGGLTMPTLTFSGANTFTFGDNITTTGDTTFSGTATYTSGGNTFTVSSVGVTRTIAGGGASIAKLALVGNASKTSQFNLSGNITVTGVFTITGNSVTNRVMVQSNILGTQRTITNTGATMAWQNCDFSDIALSTAYDASGITGNSGDAQGNTNITFTTPATQTWSGTVSGNWSTNAWTTRVPLPQDPVLISSAFSAGTQTVTIDMPRACAAIDTTGSSNPFRISFGSNTIGYGSLTLSSNVTLTGGAAWSFGGRTAMTLTSAGAQFSGNCNLSGPGGTVTQQDALNVAGNIFINAGTWNANNFSVTTGTMRLDSSTVARGVTMGSGTWALTSTATGNIWNTLATGLTITANTSTIIISNASTNTRTFVGSGATYNNLTYTVTNSPGALAITGANTFNIVSVSSGKQLIMPISITNTITTFNVNGANNGYEYLPGVSGNYISVPDAAPLDITSDITLDAKINLASWSAPTAATIIGKFGTAGNKAYALGITSAGKITLTTSVDGTATILSTSTVATGFSANSTNWVRACVQVNDGSGHNVVKFFTGGDGSWSQLGTTITNSGTTSIFNTSQVLEIGSDTTGTLDLFIGEIFEARVFNSNLGTSTGTAVFDANFITKPFGQNTFTESSSNAATVTITGALAQVGDGRLSLISSSGGTQATMNSSNVQICGNLVIQDSNVTGGPWYAN